MMNRSESSLWVRRYRLTLHDTVYFATREMGTLVETERYFHNYALAYALFADSMLARPYYAGQARPTYAEDLEVLNEHGIYITPASPLHTSYVFATNKMAQIAYHQQPIRFGPPNYPRNIGRIKELAPESLFEFFALGDFHVKLPHWIRLGKWMSKTEVLQSGDAVGVHKVGPYHCAIALNPLDIGDVQLRGYNLISMPPVSLLADTLLYGDYLEFKMESKEFRIPFGMRYTFPEPSLETKKTRRSKKTPTESDT